MTRFFLSAILITGLAFSLPTSSAGQTPPGCQVVRGQIVCDKSAGQIPTTGCITPRFTTVFPLSPLALFKDSQFLPLPPQPSRNIRGDDIDCKIRFANPQYCAAVYVYKSARLSDVYLTNNNEVVQAFWNVTYREDQEMVALLGKGQTVYNGTIHFPDGSTMAGPTMGHTYPVSSKDFDCFKALTDSEKAFVEAKLRAFLNPLQKNFRIVGNTYQPLVPFHWFE